MGRELIARALVLALGAAIWAAPAQSSAENPISAIGRTDLSPGPILTTTVKGSPVTAIRFARLKPDCRPIQLEVSVRSPAFHGVVRIEHDTAGPSNGCRSDAASEAVVYVPDPGYVGYDEFQIAVKDEARDVVRTVEVGVTARAGDPPPSATTFLPPELPDGILEGVAAGRYGATFIDLDHSRMADGVAQLRIYEVIDPPFRLHGKDEVQQVDDRVIDCTHRTSIQHREFAFDAAGRLVEWTSENSVEPIVANSANDLLARVMCDGARMPANAYVHGHAAALALGRSAIRTGGPLTLPAP